MDIPLDSSQPVKQQSYPIQFDDFATMSIPITEILKSIPKPPVPLSTATKNNHLFPEFPQLKKKIIYKRDSQFYQVYVGQCDCISRFVYKHQTNYKDEEWGVPPPDLTHNCSSLCVEGILISGHNVSTFLRNPNSPNFDPVVNIVSAVILSKDFPSSLLQALASAHPDREVWL